MTNTGAPEFLNELQAAWSTAYASLTSQACDGHWVGELSTSALSTATAISALCQARQAHCVSDDRKIEVDLAISAGCQWLTKHQQDDGGFGDTDRSHSNIATTLLVIAATELAGKLDVGGARANSGATSEQQGQAWSYVDAQGRWDGLRRRYGKDKTFVVPILSNCALAGLVSWDEVAPLPFEAAWLPQDMYRWARMPVVSYAVPALVAIGQARFYKAPPKNLLLRKLRSRAIEPTLRVLRTMQPSSGGYLEAVPLTSFVLMNLAAIGHGSLPVAQDCLRFILDSRLADGSWPIDTNLATWLTSLSIAAMARNQSKPIRVNGAHVASQFEPASKRKPVELDICTVRWLLSCQHTRRHPFTGATPGGWGWTDLSGAVPDADDTPAALLALAALDLKSPELQRLQHEVQYAVGGGLRWLLRLQNRDGGWPTFCRGWGKLPFDRSGTDLTAHALRAIAAWSPEQEAVRRVCAGMPSEQSLRRATARGLRYLSRHQQADGSWLPLWFGNQDRPAEDNPIYGTGKVLLAYADLGLAKSPPAIAAIEFLTKQQNPDGGWGGGPNWCISSKNGASSLKNQAICSSIEETSIALEGLIQCAGDLGGNASIMLGLRWLVDAVASGGLERAAPIGFYFAKLWYYEKLYPTIFCLGAVGSALHKLNEFEKRYLG
ncbi:MAG: prenyltransferase/squalene oxidase repeat-containing protein [Pirellulaceae bacterium]